MNLKLIRQAKIVGLKVVVLKKEKLIIQLPEQCTEDWHTMTKIEQGRHCEACNNCVVDFSVMTDRELFNHFKQHQGQQICGRISEQQLNRPVHADFKRGGPFTRLKFAASLLIGGFTLFGGKSIAQDTQFIFEEEIDESSGDRIVLIRGKVLKANGKPLPDAKLQFDCGDVIISDHQGRYQFQYQGNAHSLGVHIEFEDESFNDQIDLTLMPLEECSEYELDCVLKVGNRFDDIYDIDIPMGIMDSRFLINWRYQDSVRRAEDSIHRQQQLLDNEKRESRKQLVFRLGSRFRSFRKLLIGRRPKALDMFDELTRSNEERSPLSQRQKDSREKPESNGRMNQNGLKPEEVH